MCSGSLPSVFGKGCMQQAREKRAPGTTCGSLLCPALAAGVPGQGLSFQSPDVVMPGHSAEGHSGPLPPQLVYSLVPPPWA